MTFVMSRVPLIPLIAFRTHDTTHTHETHTALSQKAEKQEKAVFETEARAQRLLQGNVDELRDARAWPSDAVARRKLYLRLSKSAHPDAGGSSAHFAALADAYQSANEMYGSARTEL